MRKILCLFVGMAVLAACSMISVAEEKAKDSPPDEKAGNPERVEVVFVLDSTGSMSGLIEGAKQKMSEEGRKRYVDSQVVKRGEINEKITELSKQRADWLSEQSRAKPAANSFDAKVSEIITRQMGGEAK